MNFIRTNIPDVIIIEPTVHGDHRGYFVETFRADKLEAFLGYKLNFGQDNESKSSKGVLRGLHYQLPPHAQTKLVRVISGRVLDVAVDIRKNSPTFGQHVAVELTADNKRQMLVPRGFAHGFVGYNNYQLYMQRLYHLQALQIHGQSLLELIVVFYYQLLILLLHVDRMLESSF